MRGRLPYLEYNAHAHLGLDNSRDGEVAPVSLAWLDKIFSIVEFLIPTTLDFYAGISIPGGEYQAHEDRNKS